MQGFPTYTRILGPKCCPIYRSPNRQPTEKEKKQIKWFPELATAVAAAKSAHHEWKEAGRPVGDHPVNNAHLQTKKLVRKTQRQHEANTRKCHLLEISETAEGDQVLMHKLIM